MINYFKIPPCAAKIPPNSPPRSALPLATIGTQEFLSSKREEHSINDYGGSKTKKARRSSKLAPS
jgi:hypothetical protein